MSNFHVGQKVVCIKDDPPKPGRCGYGDEELPVKGRVYTIRALTMWGDDPALYVEEIVNRVRHYSRNNVFAGNLEPCFPAVRFRPVAERKTDISVFQQLLNPSPARVNEPA